MSYKCTNPACKRFNQLLNPGGRIVVKEGKSFYTGSICTSCGKEMKHQSNKMGDFKNIKNKYDGRNL